jgi:hypothetical protein
MNGFRGDLVHSGFFTAGTNVFIFFFNHRITFFILTDKAFLPQKTQKDTKV